MISCCKLTWLCLKIGNIPPKRFFKWENYDKPLDIGAPCFQTKPYVYTYHCTDGQKSMTDHDSYFRHWHLQEKESYAACLYSQVLAEIDNSRPSEKAQISLSEGLWE